MYLLITKFLLTSPTHTSGRDCPEKWKQTLLWATQAAGDGYTERTMKGPFLIPNGTHGGAALSQLLDKQHTGHVNLTTFFPVTELPRPVSTNWHKKEKLPRNILLTTPRHSHQFGSPIKTYQVPPETDIILNVNCNKKKKKRISNGNEGESLSLYSQNRG